MKNGKRELDTDLNATYHSKSGKKNTCWTQTHNKASNITNHLGSCDYGMIKFQFFVCSLMQIMSGVIAPRTGQATLNLTSASVRVSRPLSQQQCDSLIVTFIATSLSPLSIVENKQFKDLIERGRTVTVHSRRTYTRQLQASFAKMVAGVKKVSTMTLEYFFF